MLILLRYDFTTWSYARLTPIAQEALEAERCGYLQSAFAVKGWIGRDFNVHKPKKPMTAVYIRNSWKLEIPLGFTAGNVCAMRS